MDWRWPSVTLAAAATVLRAARERGLPTLLGVVEERMEEARLRARAIERAFGPQLRFLTFAAPAAANDNRRPRT